MAVSLAGVTNVVMLLVGTDDTITLDTIAIQMAGEIEGSRLCGSRASRMSGLGLCA